MTLQTGQIIAKRYRVDAFLGRGGMAEVYKVWDLEKSVPIAMKVLHEDLAEDLVFYRRFTREAQTLAKLQHPNIIRFYGLERDDQLVFITMDFIEGTTLRNVLFNHKGPFTADEVHQYLVPVTAALNYAHRKGFVHCDVKPANIMVDKTGKVYLSDFGIVRMSEASTATLLGVGTPAYMAPEQISGKIPTPQTDIYSLGIVLYELLTGGERPFTGDQGNSEVNTSEKIRLQHLHSVPPDPRKYNPLISPAIASVILKCLAKNPEGRYLSTQDLLTDFENALIPNNTSKKTAQIASAVPVTSKGIEQQPVPVKIDPPIQAPVMSKIVESTPEPRKKGSVVFPLILCLLLLLFFLYRAVQNQPGSNFTLPALPTFSLINLIASPTPTDAIFKNTAIPVTGKIQITIANNSGSIQEIYVEGIFIFRLEPGEKQTFPFQKGTWRIDHCQPGTYPCNVFFYQDLTADTFVYEIK
jgi:serine/threonine protein kinase